MAVSLLLVLLTGVAAIIRWEAPPKLWLEFLLALEGISTGHFLVKRVTYKGKDF